MLENKTLRKTFVKTKNTNRKEDFIFLTLLIEAQNCSFAYHTEMLMQKRPLMLNAIFTLQSIIFILLNIYSKHVVNSSSTRHFMEPLELENLVSKYSFCISAAVKTRLHICRDSS